MAKQEKLAAAAADEAAEEQREPPREGGEQSNKPLLTRMQVARRLGTSVRSVERMHDRGQLPPRVTDESGHHFYSSEDVDQIEHALGLTERNAMARSEGESQKFAVQMLAQLMAHTDKATKNALSTNDHLLRANERYAARIEHLEDELAKCFELLKSLGDEKHTREMEQKTLAAEQERRDKALTFALEKISLLWPIVQTKMFGIPIKAGDHPAWDALKAFFDSLRTEQLQELLKSLSSDQLAAFENLTKLLTEPEAKPAT